MIRTVATSYTTPAWNYHNSDGDNLTLFPKRECEKSYQLPNPYLGDINAPSNSATIPPVYFVT